MLQEAGDLDKHVHRLKHQVIAHRRMIQHVSSSNCCLLLAAGSSGGCGSKDEDEEEADNDMMGHGHDDAEELDVLLSEHRMEEAVELLLLQRHQQGSAAALLSDRKAARVADRLASVAGNPRTPRPELLKALSGLCRLGDPERANHLLFSSYRNASVEGLSSQSQAQQAAAGQYYIKDLARMVFSSIADASRCFVALHGHPSPYAPQLLRWAREEMEDFSAAFSEYVRSMPPASPSLALEAAVSCYSSSSLLLRALPPGLGIASEQDVAGLMAPCIREVLAAYGRHLKEVVRLLVASDASSSWVLGRFLLQAAAAGGEPQHRYCLLTASGRKFVTLVQEVVDGVACPLQSLGLGMDDDAAQLVADLFREYVRCIVLDLLEEEELIIIPASSFPHKKKKELADDDEQQYTRQLSVLVNCSTLVSLLPTMAWWTASAQRQVGSLIKEAAGQVWSCFCQQFIRGTMAIHQVAEEGGTPPPAAAAEKEMMMPSLAFQVVFLRVRRLKDAYGGILMSGEDGTMKELLQELMEALISWLSSNPPESWIGHGAQAQLDVHFLLEIAQLGGLDVTASAQELLRRAAENGAGDEGWAVDAAKHAVHQMLLQQQQQQNMTTCSSASPASLNEREEEGEEAAAEDATEEFEFDDMANKDSAAAHQQGGEAASKSSDEFVSIEEADEEKQHMLRLTMVDSDDSGGRRRRQAAPSPRGRSRMKKAAGSSSRPRWQ